MHERQLPRISNRSACEYTRRLHHNIYPPMGISIRTLKGIKIAGIILYFILSLTRGGFQLASTITRALQTERLTKKARHPNIYWRNT